MPALTSTPARPRVLVTRAPGQNSTLAEHLRTLGADPILIPAIELAPPTSWRPLDAALDRLASYHWLIFTSANAVQAYFDRQVQPRTPQGSHPASIPDGHPKIAAIGAATAQLLRQQGLTPDLIPPQAVAESLAEALLSHVRQPDGAPTRFLLVRAEQARELVPETLRAAGAEVTVVPAYRTVIPETSITLLQHVLNPDSPRPDGIGPPDAVTFTSSSTARNLLALCEAAGVALPPLALRVSIGPVTTRTLIELGLPPHAEAHQATVAALAEATWKALALSR